MKLAASGLVHRTDLGGVAPGLGQEADVRIAFQRLCKVIEEHSARWPDLHITVSPMVHGVEMLVGTRNDPNFGPLVLLGSGGTLCELVDDVVYAKAPITPEQAEAMIDRVRAAKMLDGWRGAPAVDRGALMQTLVGLSQAAAHLPSLEINPLIVAQSGAIAVDLVIARKGPAQ